MLWWAETEFSVKPWSIVIVSALVRPLTPHGGGLLVAQSFPQLIVVYLLGITFVITLLVCT